MGKRLVATILDAAELATKYGLSWDQTVDVSCIAGRIIIHLRPLELVRISRVLDVPRSKIEVRKSDRTVQVAFVAAGARWCCCIFLEGLDDFYTALGVSTGKLAAAAKGIERVGTALLEHKR